MARLRRLEDEAAIRATLHAYGSALDYGDRAQFLDCFTADAEYVVVLRTSGAVAYECRGHDELAAYFDAHTHAPTAWHKHVVTNITVEVDGDSATAASYFLRIDAAPDAGPGTVLASGRYLDRLARNGDRWRIAGRRCEVENL